MVFFLEDFSLGPHVYGVSVRVSLEEIPVVVPQLIVELELHGVRVSGIVSLGVTPTALEPIRILLVGLLRDAILLLRLVLAVVVYLISLRQEHHSDDTHPNLFISPV